MSTLKRLEKPSLFSSNWLSDWFENDRLFDADFFRKASLPAANIHETESGYVLELAAPGKAKSDFTVTVEKGILTISSRQQQEKEEKEKTYTRKEFSYSAFSRSFTLPENASEENIKATYENGLLKLDIPKVAAHAQKPVKTINIS